MQQQLYAMDIQNETILSLNTKSEKKATLWRYLSLSNFIVLLKNKSLYFSRASFKFHSF